MRGVIVFGGYGTFGAQVCHALAAAGVPLVIAGRSAARASRLAQALGGNCRARAVELTDPVSCRQALHGQGVAVNCAGPFNQLGTSLLDACLEADCHYADITDDRGYAALVRGYDERFRQRGLVAVYGCSSLPGISGALAQSLLAAGTAPVERARVTLFIGNNNPKGPAAVRSLLASLGRPIAAPQGTLYGFRDREVVPLPEPFGDRGVFTFESPEYDLFPGLCGARAVSVKLGFELRLATYLFAALASVGSGYGAWTARLLDLPARLFRGLGCSGGAVMTELFSAGGAARRAALVALQDGQRMAALPCAFVAQALSEGRIPLRGVATAYDFLGAAPLLQRLIAAGFTLRGTLAAANAGLEG